MNVNALVDSCLRLTGMETESEKSTWKSVKEKSRDWTASRSFGRTFVKKKNLLTCPMSRPQIVDFYYPSEVNFPFSLSKLE